MTGIRCISITLKYTTSKYSIRKDSPDIIHEKLKYYQKADSKYIYIYIKGPTNPIVDLKGNENIFIQINSNPIYTEVSHMTNRTPFGISSI